MSVCGIFAIFFLGKKPFVITGKNLKDKIYIKKKEKEKLSL